MKPAKITCAVALAWTLAACASFAASPRTDEPIQPIQPPKGLNAAKVELGEMLYFDPRLSASGIISCNTCHNLAMGGTDNLQTSIGHKWTAGPINAPTVLNSSFALAQFWDGRAADLKAQAAGPIQAGPEMSMPHDLAVDVINSIPGYGPKFKAAFGTEKADIDKITEAIAEFEKTLVTPNSRFDKWLQGDDKALSADELAGWKLFKDSGCVACHNGPAAGGTSFQKMGVVAEYKAALPAEGRAAVTGKDADRFNFKVPTLRNVELTYPYFHDGAARTLDQAVDIMGRLQLGREFSATERGQIVAFLKTLTGDQPKITLPTLPPSSDKTPAPNPFRE